jgi:hypothetical protein
VYGGVTKTHRVYIYGMSVTSREVVMEKRTVVLLVALFFIGCSENSGDSSNSSSNSSSNEVGGGSGEGASNSSSNEVGGGSGEGASNATAGDEGSAILVDRTGSDAIRGNVPYSMPEAPTGSEPTMLPETSETCPALVTGTVQILGVNVVLEVGQKSDQKAPIFIYWHGTGGSGTFGTFDIDANLKSEVLAQGGVIASPDGSLGTGDQVDWGVWKTGDFAMADQIVACAIEQLNIDTTRIYSGGTSAGALMAGAFAIGRSGYVAAVTPNSGGIVWPVDRQDTQHVPAAMTMHGATGRDKVVVDFATQSLILDNDIIARGGFAVDCDHGGGHGGAPMDLRDASWEFLKAHPYGTKPSPYANGLPATFPSYCTIVK